jgi:hypothetical protein
MVEFIPIGDGDDRNIISGPSRGGAKVKKGYLVTISDAWGVEQRLQRIHFGDDEVVKWLTCMDVEGNQGSSTVEQRGWTYDDEMIHHCLPASFYPHSLENPNLPEMLSGTTWKLGSSYIDDIVVVVFCYWSAILLLLFILLLRL